jgi:hypothetical protein
MAEKKKGASPWEVAKAVFWSFLGIRRRAQHEKDVGRLKPAQVIIAGLIGALIFVVAIASLARYIGGHVG